MIDEEKQEEQIDESEEEIVVELPEEEKSEGVVPEERVTEAPVVA